MAFIGHSESAQGAAARVQGRPFLAAADSAPLRAASAPLRAARSPSAHGVTCVILSH